MGQLAADFSLLWRNFFRGCIALIGLIASLRVLTAPLASGYFFQVEITALRYTRSLLVKSVGKFTMYEKGKGKNRKIVRLVNSMARQYPPVLLVAAMASVPLVMATSYYVVHSTSHLL